MASCGEKKKAARASTTIFMVVVVMTTISSSMVEASILVDFGTCMQNCLSACAKALDGSYMFIPTNCDKGCEEQCEKSLAGAKFAADLSMETKIPDHREEGYHQKQKSKQRFV